MHIPKEMNVAVMLGMGQMGWEKRSLPVPGPEDVLVKVEHVGICGSDMHYYEAGRIGDYIVRPPFVLGHESGGTVVAVGESVRHLAVGDRVALEPGITCGKCEFCTTGRYNLCPEVVFFATPPVDGVFAEYVTHPAALAFKIPANMDTMEAALIEPLAVGFHAANQGKARMGQCAVVFGSGCIGLCSLMALKAQGLSRVFVVDIMEKRLKKALELGADGVINAGRQDVVAEAQRLAGAGGVDLVVETSGVQAAAGQAIALVKKGGNIVFVGYPASGEMTLPMSLAMDKELTLNTVFRYRHVYPVAIDAVASGKVNVRDMVTTVFDFAHVGEAMNESVRNKADIVKSVIKIA